MPPEKLPPEKVPVPPPPVPPPILFSLTDQPVSMDWPPSMKLEIVPLIEFASSGATAPPPKYAFRATSAVNRPERSSSSAFPS